jgi:methionyl aminopeptidase
MIHLKTQKELQTMAEGGKILSEAMDDTLSKVRAGIKLSELDSAAEQAIIARGATASFKKVKGYRWTICACVNDVVVHGIPNDYLVKDNDVVGIDCGVYYKGFHTDASWTVRVRGKEIRKNDEVDDFLKVGREALFEGINQVKEGNFIYDISKAIGAKVEGSGYSVVRTLVGHGIGRALHEDPEVPGRASGIREKTPQIVQGMALAVEVIYAMGAPEVVYRGDDGWTISTKDGKISGLFEATVAVTDHGCIVLTLKEDPRKKSVSV